jgi:ectoine hydroxylase-related dioxygenase (phytanoyl-CoA dioxygenase family)
MATSVIHYPELVGSSTWGDDKILLLEDTNLVEHSGFNEKGFGIFEMKDYNGFLKELVKARIQFVTGKEINIAEYHVSVSAEEHKLVLNSMPYKKHDTPELTEFCKYLEELVSDKLNERVKIFNDDIWVRICRPNAVSNDDFNPCHRDIYLDFYRNTANIYLPIVGSNENSSLFMQEGSHLWNENMTAITTGGAFFPSSNKKYSVDAIVQSKVDLTMVRPNPAPNEVLIFSPYLIHGCSDNKNTDTTRMSLEIRFIRDDDIGKQQEKEFNEFLTQRVWR